MANNFLSDFLNGGLRSLRILLTIGNTDVDDNNPVPAKVVDSLPAGTSVIGNVGIDQTTPGVTNGVQVNAAIPTGTNIIGKTVPVDTDGDEKFTSVNPAVMQLSGSNTPKSGQKNVTTAGTQVALGTTQVYKELTVIAKSTNTGNIYVGDSTVGSATGAILPAGGFITFHFVDIAAVYIDSDVNGEGVSFGGDA